MPTELWRHPLNWGPKVQAQQRKTLRQKDKDLSFEIFVFLTGRAVGATRLFLFCEEESLWTSLFKA